MYPSLPTFPLRSLPPIPLLSFFYSRGSDNEHWEGQGLNPCTPRLLLAPILFPSPLSEQFASQVQGGAGGGRSGAGEQPRAGGSDPGCPRRGKEKGGPGFHPARPRAAAQGWEITRTLRLKSSVSILRHRTLRDKERGGKKKRLLHTLAV